MFTLTEELVTIPAGTMACSCLTCDRVVFFVDRPSGVRCPVEVTADGEHHYPRQEADGVGRPHLAHCSERRR